jgi:hypothetical protein
MSKPIARVAIFVLLSLLLIAATSVGVRGWLGGARETAHVQAHLVSGIHTNFNHQRSTASELESLQLQSGSYSQPSSSPHQGGCHSNNQTSPQD